MWAIYAPIKKKKKTVLLQIYFLHYFYFLENRKKTIQSVVANPSAYAKYMNEPHIAMFVILARRVAAGESGVQGYPWLHTKFDNILSCKRPCLKKKLGRLDYIYGHLLFSWAITTILFPRGENAAQW